MTNNNPQASDDSWKDLASAIKPSKAGRTVQLMVARMNEIWPLANAKAIFDNGCGTGSIISYIIDTYGANIPNSAGIVAGDLSEAMLDVLRKTKQDNTANPGDIWDRLAVRSIDAQDPSLFTNDSISHVTGGHLYFLLPDAQKALRETHRILCPGGVIAMTTGKSSQHIDALCAAVETVRPGTNLKLLREPWSSEEGVKAELAAAGFVDAETHLVDSELSYTDHREFAKMLLLMPVMKDAIEGYSEQERLELSQQLISNLRSISPTLQGTVKGVGIIALARKPT